MAGEARKFTHDEARPLKQSDTETFYRVFDDAVGALDRAVRSGKALYVGISAYDPQQTLAAVKILRELGSPCLIQQPKYSMFVREPEQGLLDVLGKEGVGCIPFSPLAQGLLTDKYLQGIPSDSRAARDFYLKRSEVSKEKIAIVNALNEIAKRRGQSLAQMAIAWVLRDGRVTSALIGASRVEQIEELLGALSGTKFSAEELSRIDRLLGGQP